MRELARSADTMAQMEQSDGDDVLVRRRLIDSEAGERETERKSMTRDVFFLWPLEAYVTCVLIKKYGAPVWHRCLFLSFACQAMPFAFISIIDLR